MILTWQRFIRLLNKLRPQLRHHDAELLQSLLREDVLDEPVLGGLLPMLVRSEDGFPLVPSTVLRLRAESGSRL